MGSDFRNAYVPGTALTGAGQTVGLLQFDSGFFQTDITAYETQAGLPNVPVVPVLLDGYDGGPGFDNGEVSLDIEMVMSMAPGVSKILVFEGEVTDDILNAMAASNQVKQLSASWSYPIDRGRRFSTARKISMRGSVRYSRLATIHTSPLWAAPP